MSADQPFTSIRIRGRACSTVEEGIEEEGIEAEDEQHSSLDEGIEKVQKSVLAVRRYGC